jgi:hypothetical protein
MKIYRILGFALLMSGLVHARSITVVNNSTKKIWVQTSHIEPAMRKDKTTGVEDCIGSSIYKDDKFYIESGKRKTFSYSDKCGKDSLSIKCHTDEYFNNRNGTSLGSINMNNGQTVTIDKDMKMSVK